MEKSRNRAMEEILNRTLEIISLLYGENFTAVKYGDLVTIMVPPHQLVIPETTKEKKILELTEQITELLTGERGILGHSVITSKYKTGENHSDANKEALMEDQPYLEDHQEPYKEAMMEDQPLGGSEKRPIPERRLHPPHHPGDSTQEHHPADGLGEIKPLSRPFHPPQSRVSIQNIPLRYQESSIDICPHPPRVRNSTLEEPGDHYESEDLTVISDEDEDHVEESHKCMEKEANEEKKEEPRARGNQRFMEKVGSMVTNEEKDDKPRVRGDQRSMETIGMRLVMKEEVEEPRVKAHQWFIEKVESMAANEEKESRVGRDQWLMEKVGPMVANEEKDNASRVRDDQRSMETFGMRLMMKEEVDECETWKAGMMVTAGEEDPHRMRAGQRSVEEAVMTVTIKEEEEELQVRADHWSVEEVESFQDQTDSNIMSAAGHNVWNNAEDHLTLSPTWFLDKEDSQDYSKGTLFATPPEPSNPGESFPRTPLQHPTGSQRGKRFPCNECGRVFDFKSCLEVHRRSHTGERPFSCQECGKCFVHKFSLVRHMKNHTTDNLYACSKCRKSFTSKSDLLQHYWIHTGEKPYTCPE